MCNMSDKRGVGGGVWLEVREIPNFSYVSIVNCNKLWSIGLIKRQ